MKIGVLGLATVGDWDMIWAMGALPFWKPYFITIFISVFVILSIIFFVNFHLVVGSL